MIYFDSKVVSTKRNKSAGINVTSQILFIWTNWFSVSAFVYVSRLTIRYFFTDLFLEQMTHAQICDKNRKRQQAECQTATFTHNLLLTPVICNWSWDPSFCFISGFFRLVTEEHGVDLNTKNYAQMKRNACQARARNLRLLVQSNPSSDNGNSSVRCVDGYSFVCYSILILCSFIYLWFLETHVPRPTPTPLCEGAHGGPKAPAANRTFFWKGHLWKEITNKRKLCYNAAYDWLQGTVAIHAFIKTKHFDLNCPCSPFSNISPPRIDVPWDIL